MLPSVLILGVVAYVAWRLALVRQSPSHKQAQRMAASHALALATVIQGVHFAEELTTGFQVQFPAMFGLQAMSLPFFVAFNLAWIGIWTISIFGLRSGQQAAFFATWFLAIAGMLNAIAHPLVAVASGGYFPGLVSSPFVGVASLWLWRKLRSATSV